ncbi:MAG: hypothetical protein GKR90_10595 [Pseudomonadales bacterium]|nr:hypothetical protein [Pseudomonadales bacterium]
MNQTVFNVTLSVAVVCIAAILAFSVYQAQPSDVVDRPVGLQQQIELLTQKVVLLRARQPDEQALLGQIEELEARILSIQQQLDQARLRPQNSTQKNIYPGEHHASTTL